MIIYHQSNVAAFAGNHIWYWPTQPLVQLHMRIGVFTASAASGTIAIARVANIVTVTLTSALQTTPGETIYYYWYLDGVFIERTVRNRNTFFVSTGDQARVDVVDSLDADLDVIANAPSAYPARRSIVWVRSADTTVARYRIEQQKSGGAWETIGTVVPLSQHWSLSVLSPRLDDLTNYAWRVVPVDADGNDGTILALPAEQIVRRPDTPNFTAKFSPGTTRVTFKAAA